MCIFLTFNEIEKSHKYTEICPVSPGFHQNLPGKCCEDDNKGIVHLLTFGENLPI